MRSLTTSPRRNDQSMSIFSFPVAASRTTQCIRLVVKLPEEMVEQLNPVEHWDFTRRVKFHVDHVALGGRDDNALDPRLSLEVSEVAGDDFHTRAGKGQVEGAGVGDVGEVE